MRNHMDSIKHALLQQMYLRTEDVISQNQTRISNGCQETPLWLWMWKFDKLLMNWVQNTYKEQVQNAENISSSSPCSAWSPSERKRTRTQDKKRNRLEGFGPKAFVKLNQKD